MGLIFGSVSMRPLFYKLKIFVQQRGTQNQQENKLKVEYESKVYTITCSHKV